MDAIGIGDLHLTGTSGSGAWSKYWPGNSDVAILQEAQKAVDYGKSKGIANIFLYGDVCDAPKMSYQAHQALLDFFGRNSDCQFYIILGNHEMLTANSSTHALSLLQAFSSACPNVHIYDKPTLEKIDGAKVNFLPFPHAEFNSQALNVCHVDVAGSFMDSGIASKSSIDVGENVVVAGHIHTSGQVKECYYSGTMIQTNFGESIQKYFHLIHFNSIDDYEIQLIPTKPNLLLMTAIVNSKVDIDDAVKTSKKLSQKQVWRLIIADGAEIDAEDYESLNVVQVKSFSTKKDLQELASGSIDYVSVDDIKPEDVFLKLLQKREDIDDEMKKEIIRVRRKVLKL